MSHSCKRFKNESQSAYRFRMEYWRCYHCDTTFPNTADGKRAAAKHFGSTDDAPVCKVLDWYHPIASYVRDLNATLESYRNEDNAILRAMATIESDHAQALRCAEEEGYARGIRDAKL